MSRVRRILLVDDDDSVREVARASLELVGGYQVATASSGEECLELSSASPPDAILLDVMMPGLDGPSTFARLRDQPQTAHVPVVFLTAKSQEADQRRLRALGVAGVIPKPFDPVKLAGELAQIVGWPPASASSVD